MTTNTKSKHILILGGMGPQASLYAHRLVIKAAEAKGAADNEDYPRITHLSVNVKDFISNPTNRQEAFEYLARCLKEINGASVDKALIACNTAHMLQEQLEEASGIEFTSLIETTAQAIISEPALKHVGVLATPSTLQTGLYGRELQTVTDVIEPDADSSERVEQIIRQVIGGGDQTELARSLEDEIHLLKAKGADKVVLGCTELSLLGSFIESDSILDPLALTIESIV